MRRFWGWVRNKVLGSQVLSKTATRPTGGRLILFTCDLALHFIATRMASLDKLQKRCVFVEVINGRANAPYEIILENSSTEKVTYNTVKNVWWLKIKS